MVEDFSLRPRARSVRALAAVLALGLVSAGCLRLDVTEGGTATVEPAGSACAGFEPKPPREPEYLTQSCHGYGDPTLLTLAAVPDEGFEFRRWDGLPSTAFSCDQSPSCTFLLTGPIHVTAVFEPVIPDFAPDWIVVDRDGIAYLLSSENRTIFRYSLATRRWLVPIPIGPGARFVAYAEPSHRLYLAYADGTLTRIDLSRSRSEQPFAQLTASWRGVQGLTTVGDFVVSYHTPGYQVVLTVFGPDGGIVDSSDYRRHWSYHFATSASHPLLFHLRDGVSPNDVVVDEIDPVTGAIGGVFDSPYHGEFPVHGPIMLSPDASKLLLASGEVLGVPDLQHERSLPRSFADGVWSEVGLLTLVKTPDGDTLLENWDDAYHIQDLRFFTGSPIRIIDSIGAFHVVTMVDGRPAFDLYRPSEDADGDGVPNREDDFPLDPGVSRDTDGDGAPDPPTRRRPWANRDDDRVYDAFPDDSACQLPEHGRRGRCDIAGSIPEYAPDRVLVADDIVYLFSSENARVYRWSIPRARHLNPIVTRDDATDIALSTTNHRLYIGYPDGEITQVDLAQPHEELPFGAVAHWPIKLGSARGTVVAIDQPSNWYRATAFDPDGRKTSWRSGLSSFTGNLVWAPLVWEPALSRLYTGRISQWITIDPETHTVVGTGSKSVWGPEPWTPLARFALDGSVALQGPRFFRRMDTYEQVGELPHAVTDGEWREDGIVTVAEAATGGALLEQWGLESDLFAAVDLSGAPVAVRSWSGGMVAVTLVDGRPAFTTYVPTDDADGDGVENLVDDFDVDPAASLDSDGDGYPDAWNPGSDESDSTTGLSLDAFPQDPECWAPEHEHKGVCDVARRLPDYEPDLVLEGGDVIYLLGIDEERVFRWSWDEEYHLEPVEIGPNATGAAHLDESGRLYVSYWSGSITQLDPAAEPMLEEPFAVDFERMLRLTAAGRFLVGTGKVGNSLRRAFYTVDGTKLREGGGDFPQHTEWNDAKSRIYYISYSDLVSFEIDQETSEFGAYLSSGHHAGFSAWGRFRVRPDGSKVVMGGGMIYAGDTLEPIATLPEQAFDSHWLDDGLATIRPVEGNTILERWDERLRLVATETFPGEPIAIYGRGERVVVITLSDQQPAFHLYQLGDDHDGDGVPFGEDDFPMDPAASIDGDGDGYPESWNPGRDATDTTTGLTLDAFPDDFACYLAEHDDGGSCDFDRVLPPNRETPICEVDSPPADVMQGRLPLGPTAAYLALCDGWVVHSDTWSDRVVVQNVFDARLGRIVPLPGRPGELALDDDRHVLFVTLPEDLQVAAIDLVTSDVAVIDVPETPQELAVDNDGGLFIVADKDMYGTLYYLPPGDTNVSVGWDIEGIMIEYNAARDELVTSDIYWPDLARYSFDPADGPTLLQIRGSAANAKELAVSPDGEHVAQAAGAGNGSGYNVWDFAGGDLETVYGQWDTGAYPQAAAFDATSRLFLSTEGDQFIIFDVQTHDELIREWAPACSYGNLNRAAFSRGGRIALMQQICGIYDERAYIHFLVLEE